MGEFVFRLPDVGEGLSEAELVQWQVSVGDIVAEDQVIAAVMTDKATVDIPSPVSGKVLWLGGDVGDVLAIGADLIRFAVDGDGNINAAAVAKSAADSAAKPDPDRVAVSDAATQAATTTEPASASVSPKPAVQDRPDSPAAAQSTRATVGKPLAAPSVRKRAMDAGADLRQISGTGPAGRITHEDLDAWLQADQSGAGQAGPAGGVSTMANTTVTEVKVVGMRRKIAEKMVISKTRIPHITYVEEIDMTKLEELRETLNESRAQDQARLTLLPFLMRAIVRAVAEQPAVNATFDDEAGVISQYGGVHIGIATQTDAGLVVPVVRHAEILDVWGCAAQVNSLAQAARDSALTRDELTGSSITISSLGPMGGIVTTPVINHPEVAIVGVNKMVMRPLWDGSQFVPRKMMNISASFDHRVIDGWDAATFVQKIKSLLETPAMIFMQS